ncbi:MAG TPA: 6-pyruvoyl-tetrahydropterin synthase-related protein [Blastocatellia bacterium]|nr:6-pyruvoyl-tetrahydropterin synthase-related protein [Blastocatellia bacterium]
MHLFIMPQFDKVLRSGVIYPRWIPDINRGYGLLNMIYYPPGFFYLTSAVHTVVDDWIYTTFVVSALALAGSGLALYFLARTFYSKPASAIAAFVYMLIPFHVLDLYWRGALPQFVGYCFLPLVIYFAFRLGREGRARYYAGLGVTFGLYLLIHLPVSLMLAYALGFYALVWALRERDLRIALRIAGGVFLGLLLSAIYWLPAAVEAKYTYEVASTLYPYDESYITLLPIKEGIPYVTFWKLLNDVFAAHAVALAAPVIVLLLAVPRSSRTEFGAGPNPSTGGPERGLHHWSPTSMWMVMGLATVFMCTSFSIYVSKLLPKIQVAVPAWRWLVLASVFTALLIGACVDRLGKNSELNWRTLWGYRVLLGGAVTLALWVSVHGIIVGAMSNPTYHPKVDVISNLIEPNFTPKAASRPENLPDTPLVVIMPTGGSSEIISWQPQYREISVSLEAASVVRLKTYNFPGWTARIDGQAASILSDGNGVQTISVPPGTHRIEVSFRNSPVRAAGLEFSGLALVAIIALIVFDYRSSPRAVSDSEDREV